MGLFFKSSQALPPVTTPPLLFPFFLGEREIAYTYIISPYLLDFTPLSTM
jgi:hypothetical protein